MTLDGIFREGFPEGEATVILSNDIKYLIEVEDQKLIRSKKIHPKKEEDPRKNPFRKPEGADDVELLPFFGFFPGVYTSEEPHGLTQG
jgi:hypothetical protein